MEATQLLVEIGTPEGKMTGLRQDSVVNCVNLLTVEKVKVMHTIGTLPAPLMSQLDNCLRVALQL